MTKAQAEQLQRATEIAREHGHTVQMGKSRKTGETVYLVKSHSVKNLSHVLYIRQGRLICDCKAHQQGKVCSHAAAVRQHLIDERKAQDAAILAARAAYARAYQPAQPTIAAQMEQYHATVRAWNDAALAETEASLAARRQYSAEAEAEQLLAARWQATEPESDEERWERYQDCRISGCWY